MSSKLDRLEARLADVEQELRELKTRLGEAARVPWYRQIVGAFANDPVYAEIARLGRQIRNSEDVS